MTNLTEREKQFVQHVAGINGCGAKSWSDLLEDNFSWFYPRELKQFGYTEHQISGFISSLSNKRVLGYDGSDGYSAEHFIVESWIEEVQDNNGFEL